MKILDIIRSSNSNLFRNKARTFLTILAIFIGAFTISLTMGINLGVTDYINKQVKNIGGETQIILNKEDSAGPSFNNEPVKYKENNGNKLDVEYINEKELNEIRTVNNIKTAELFDFFKINYIVGKTKEKYVLNASSSVGLEVEMNTGKQVNDKSLNNEINITPEFVSSLGYKNNKDILNKEIIIGVPEIVSGEVSEIKAMIVGVRSQNLIQGGVSLINKQLAQKITDINQKGMPEGMKNKSMAVSATMVPNLETTEINVLKQELQDKGYSSITVEDQIGMVKNIINAITGVLTLFGAISLLAASFGIINTLYMSVQERTREIGLMKSMGLSDFKIFVLFSFEALLIGFLGSLLGVLSAAGVGAYLNKLATKLFASGLEGLQIVKINISLGLLIIAIIMFISFLAGTLPAKKAAKLNPINALTYE